MHFAKALITGASSGIGKALAHLLTEQNIPLLLSGRNSEKLHELSEILSKKVPTDYLACDLASKKDRDTLIDYMRLEKPDLIINNAGFALYGRAHAHPVSEEMAIGEVNALAPLEVTLEAIKMMIDSNKKGVIMNISSVAGENPSPGMAVYGASKSFLTHLSSSLDTEVAHLGIRVLVSCPGQVDTEFAHRAASKHLSFRKGPILSPEYAARCIWKQIKNKKGKNIFDWRYKCLTKVAAVLPKPIYNRYFLNTILSRL